jgi:hypothetical protein
LLSIGSLKLNLNAKTRKALRFVGAKHAYRAVLLFSSRTIVWTLCKAKRKFSLVDFWISGNTKTGLARSRLANFVHLTYLSSPTENLSFESIKKYVP